MQIKMTAEQAQEVLATTDPALLLGTWIRLTPGYPGPTDLKIVGVQYIACRGELKLTLKVGDKD